MAKLLIELPDHSWFGGPLVCDDITNKVSTTEDMSAENASEIKEYAQRFGVEFRIREEVNRIHGRSVVEFTGTPNAIAELARTHYDDFSLGEAILKAVYDLKRSLTGDSMSARRARATPGVWVQVRTGMATGNMVTEIRAGKHPNFPPTEFEARSFKEARVTTSAANGPRSYKTLRGIEVRYVPRTDALSARIGKIMKDEMGPYLSEPLIVQLTSRVLQLIDQEGLIKKGKP